MSAVRCLELVHDIPDMEFNCALLHGQGVSNFRGAFTLSDAFKDGLFFRGQYTTFISRTVVHMALMMANRQMLKLAQEYYK